MNEHLLTILTFLPAAGALGLAFLGPKAEKGAKIGALVVSLVVLALAGVAAVSAGPLGCDYEWVGALNIRYAMSADGLALAMIVLTALLTPLCVLASWHAIHDRVKGFLINLLLLEAAVIGVFCARDLFLFYVFWEAMLIPMALLIGIWGGTRRIYASVKFFLYTMAGSVLMLVAILYLGVNCGSFDMNQLPALIASERKLPADSQQWLFLAFALAFAIKVPMFPLHTWLPDAHVEAPTAGSVMLAGVLLKMGAYGFLRIAIPFFPRAAEHYQGLFITLSVVSVIFGALMSMAQSDIKKLIAYSSVSHMGFVMLGIFSFTMQGLQGAILQMVNHGISTGALFLLVGVIYERAHCRGVDDFGGLTKVMPRYAAVFLVVTLSSIGLPGLNGFVGEFLTLLGGFLVSPWAAAVASTGVILGAVYMLNLYRGVFFGKMTSSKYEKLKDLSWLEMAYLAPLVLLIVVLGLLPMLVLHKTHATSDQIHRQMRPEVDRGR